MIGLTADGRIVARLALLGMVASMGLLSSVMAVAADTRTLKDCAACGPLRVIPAGSFTMGSPESEEGRTIASGGEGNGPADPAREAQHPVAIARAFAIGEHPVTRGEYAVFVRKTRYQPINACFSADDPQQPPRMTSDYTWEHPGFVETSSDPKLPAVCVSAIDALAYVGWLSAESGKHYRLPTEAEWEYAARAGTTTIRFWGDSPDDGCAYANGVGTEAQKIFTGTAAKCDDHQPFISPVGFYQPNAFGLYDMLGNVWQWVADCWHPGYVGAPADGSAWGQEPNCKGAVLRGGSFISNYTSLRSAARHQSWPAAQFQNYGFRVARDL